MDSKEEITKILYQNSTDCSEGMIINFRNIPKVIDMLTELVELQKEKNMKKTELKSFADKAKEIGIALYEFYGNGNGVSDFNHVRIGDEDGTVGVHFIQYHNGCDNYEETFYLEDEDFESSMEEIIERHQKIIEKEEKEKERIRSEFLEKCRIEDDKKDRLIYERLKTKFEDSSE